MSSPTAYVAIAAVSALRALNSFTDLPSSKRDLLAFLNSTYSQKFEDHQIEKVIRQLQAWDCVTVIDDKYAGQVIQFYRSTLDKSIGRLRELGHEDLLEGAAISRGTLFLKVFENKSFWEDFDNDPISQPLVTEEITDLVSHVPASDRIVLRSDNQPELDVLHADIGALSNEICTNNEVSVELGDEKDLIQGELKAADTLISQPIFRLSRLTNLILPALRYLAEKFASGAIGEMAKRIIGALIGLT